MRRIGVLSTFLILSLPAVGMAVTPISSGIPMPFSFAPVTSPTLNRDFFSITVPARTAKLEIRLNSDTPGANLGLYVRFGQDVGLLGGTPIADQTSLVSLTANQSVTILASSNEGIPAGTYYIAVGVFTGGTITGTVTATATVTESLVVPQFVNGGGWSTTLYLTNLSDTTVEGFEVRFYNDAGAQRGVPLVGLGLSSSIRRFLNPGETVSYETLDTGNLESGWASIVPDTPVANRIAGFAVFRSTRPGQPPFEATVPLSTLADRSFAVLYDHANGFQSGLALANPSAAPVDIFVTIRDDAGQIIGLDVINLGPFAHRAFFLSDVYFGLTGRKGSITFVADPPIAALALRFSPAGPFTTAPSLLNANIK
jgi:hypothetical protein